MMGIFFTVFFVISGLAIFGFLKLGPKYHDNPYQVTMFNRMILSMVALLCVVWSFTIYTSYVDTQVGDGVWFVILGGCCAIITGLLVIFFFVRNFWIFKPKGYFRR